MNESVDGMTEELFVVRQELNEARMALAESSLQKEQLRDVAASLLAELRAARDRVQVLEGHLRRVERERELAQERAEARSVDAIAVREALVRAQQETVSAYEATNENELAIDQLQLEQMELRAELWHARGFERRND